jgi:RNA polymerase sigma-70 factor (ECF subfamily)
LSDYQNAPATETKGMSIDPQEFQSLLQGLRAGSQEAARRLVAGYGQVVLRVIRRRLHKRMRTKFDSDDFAQSVWGSFFATPLPEQGLERPEDLVHYLMALANNKVVDAIRQRVQGIKRNVTNERSLDGSAAGQALGLVDAKPTPSQAVMAKDIWDEVRARVERPGRRILEMIRLGMTRAEIAAALGVTEKTVQRLYRRLGEELQP